MWLIRNGVPEDTAWNLTDGERLARCVVFARFEGREYDWSTGRYKDAAP